MGFRRSSWFRLRAGVYRIGIRCGAGGTVGHAHRPRSYNRARHNSARRWRTGNRCQRRPRDTLRRCTCAFDDALSGRVGARDAASHRRRLTPFPITRGGSSLVGFMQRTSAALLGAVVGHMLGFTAWLLAAAVGAMGCASLLLWLLCIRAGREGVREGILAAASTQTKASSNRPETHSRGMTRKIVTSARGTANSTARCSPAPAGDFFERGLICIE